MTSIIFSKWQRRKSLILKGARQLGNNLNLAIVGTFYYGSVSECETQIEQFMAKAMYNMIHTILGMGIAHTAPIFAGWAWLPKIKITKKLLQGI